LLLVMSPATPLWPAGWCIEHYGPHLRSSKLASRALDTCETKTQRAEVFAPVIAWLPPAASLLG
jgi:hypothetical protein